MESDQKLKSQNPNQLLNNYAKYSSIGFQMIFIIVAGTFGGIKLDEYTGFQFPLFTVVCSLAAVALAIYTSIKDFLKPKK